MRPAGGKDCTHSGGWGDGYGHGLGVASILGARDNHRGTVGILPGVRLWSVRIFDSKGRTRLSWVLCGLDWVASKRDPHDRHRPFFEGATLSFSSVAPSRGFVANRNCGRRPLDLVHQAVCRIERQGTILVAAAGNYGQKAGTRRPAGYERSSRSRRWPTSTASRAARDANRGRVRRGPHPSGTTGSRRSRRYGAGVDLIAPGKCIWVAFRGKSYARVSGTSFAAPMVLGAALLYRRRYPDAGPNQVRQALIYAGRQDWRTGSDPDRIARAAGRCAPLRARHRPSGTRRSARRTIVRGGDTVTRDAAAASAARPHGAHHAPDACTCPGRPGHHRRSGVTIRAGSGSRTGSGRPSRCARATARSSAPIHVPIRVARPKR